MNSPSKILLRNFEFKQAFDEWQMVQCTNDLAVLRGAYEEYLLGKDNAHLHTEKGDGYEAILWNNLLEKNVQVSFMLDFLRTRVIALKYYNYLSDTRLEVMDGGVKMNFERHYLKPLMGVKLENVEYPSYGNISLENCCQSNQKNALLKIMVTYYPGSSAQPFQTLMRQLLAN